MNKTILLAATVLGLLAILLGAFGVHGLGKIVGTEAVDTFETGVRYQMYHALFLLFLGIIEGIDPKNKKKVFALILLGMVLFSFSIYALALNSLTAFDFKHIAFLTPIGGLFLVFGWLLFAYCVFAKK